MKDKNVFPKDSYVVLLHGCREPDGWGTNFPSNYVYQLSADSRTNSFHVYTDKSGESNGWAHTDPKCQLLRLRAATESEIQAYKLASMPIKVAPEESYSIY